MFEVPVLARPLTRATDGVPVLLVPLAAIYAALVLVFDASLPLGVAGGVPYVLLVLMGMWLPHAGQVAVLAAVASVLTVAGYVLSPPGGIFWVVLMNRALALFAIWAAAMVVMQRIHADHVLARSREALSRHRDHLKRRLRDSTVNLRTVTDNLPIFIAQIDAEERYLFVNRTAEEWLGRPAGQILGSHIRDVFGAETYRSLLPHIQRVLGGEPHRFTRTAVYPDGVSRDVDAAVVPDRDHDGGIKGFFALVFDTTDLRISESKLRAAREQAEFANRAKTEFLANMSHELRTPLNAIMGFAEMMTLEAFGPLGDSHYKDYAGDILGSGRHLLSLVNDILDLAKVEAGEAELFESDVNVAAVIEESLRLVKDRATKNDVTLTVDTVPGLPPLRADERMVKQMLLNLLTNAVKFTEAGGSVTVRADAHTGGGIALTVEDSGIGIAQEDLPKALATFGQVENSINRTHDGTGLGLPLVRSLAELHGGGLNLKSEPGKGTRAAIWFPPGRTASSAADAAE